MTKSMLRIVSRKSPLAMWQARHVQERLLARHPGLHVEISGIKTQADVFMNTSLIALGGKGAFVKELEDALLTGQADIAVHSMKDVTVDLPEGLSLPVILLREDPRDVFISSKYDSLSDLPGNAVIGTSSLRRQCQLRAWRQDLNVRDIRGNVETRLKKLDSGEYDALILAAAGLNRLQLEERITEFISLERMLPAIGQGAMGIETREDDEEVIKLISCLDDKNTHICVMAERAFNKRLNGGCHAPVAAHAAITDEQLHINTLVGKLDGSELLRASASGDVALAMDLGDGLGRELVEKGADRILTELIEQPGK